MDVAQQHADVCVIGAGVAGLVAADELIGAGFSVDVLEAQSTVGGRVKDQANPSNMPLELGANWFSSRQTHIRQQIERFNLETIATYNEGEHLLLWNHKRSAFRGALPSLGVINKTDIIQGMVRFERIMARLKDKEPWDETLSDYDNMSFGQWIDNTLRTRMGKQFFRMVSEIVFGVESHMVSFLYVLYYSERSESLSSLISVDDGHQGFRFKYGPGQMCHKLADSIGAERMAFDTPVRGVKVIDQQVEVTTDTFTRRYRAVLCAMPPPAVRRIVFSPPLPIHRERLIQALPMGRVIKLQAIYERPFWQELGLSGQVMSNHFPLSYTIDNSPADGQRGVLAAFVCTSQAEQFMDANVDQQQLVADAIDQMFGSRFPKPIEVLIEDWAANEWIGGSYGAYFPPGVMSRMGRELREHNPPIYWCGAEYGQHHPCQMEGALESGVRSARAIAKALAAIK